MQTHELIARLAAEAEPSRPRVPQRRLSAALVSGMAVSFIIMWAWLGIRPDLASAVSTTAYWIKFGYVFVLSAAALWWTERLARPAAPARQPCGLIAATILLAAISAGLQLAAAPAFQRHALIMGSSANVCPWRIIALSLPILASVGLALKRLAPTRPVAAGTAAGLLSGAAGAVIYAFHCDESATPFVAVWYTLGILAVGALGGFSGKRLLRW